MNETLSTFQIIMAVFSTVLLIIAQILSFREISKEVKKKRAFKQYLKELFDDKSEKD